MHHLQLSPKTSAEGTSREAPGAGHECVWLVGKPGRVGAQKQRGCLALISVVEAGGIGAKRECKLTTGHCFGCEIECEVATMVYRNADVLYK